MLGVAPGDSLREIRKAARRLFIEFHPDMHSENKAFYEEKTKKLIEAYKTILSEREASGEPAAEEPPGDFDGGGEESETFEALLIKVANRMFALPAKHILEIVRVGDVRVGDAGLMADTFPFLVGLFQRREEIVMLWNLHSQLGLREMAIGSDLGRKKVAVVDWDDSAVGFLVDDVGDFIVLQKDSGETSDEIGGGGNEFIDRIIQTDEGPAGLLNLGKILYNLPV